MVVEKLGIQKQKRKKKKTEGIDLISSTKINSEQNIDLNTT